MQINFHYKAAPLLVLFLSLFISSSANASQLFISKYKVIDRNQVNLATGQLSITLNDISIGGELGLSHSISSYTSEFANSSGNLDGYREKFTGGVQHVVHSKRNAIDWFWVMRVFDDNNSIDFIINEDGSYQGLQNQLSTLVLDTVNNTYLYTKPDGTIVTYNRYTTAANSNAYMTKIQYPNGFTIYIDKKETSISGPIDRVTTNTGFQLKYIYDIHNRPLATAPDPGNRHNHLLLADSLNWSTRMPKHIIAINNAIEYCGPLTDCQLSKVWPQTTYNWPDGMPRAMFIAKSIFSVTDAMGRTTEYHHKPFDESTFYLGLDVGTPGESFVPRIVKIKDATSNITTMNYDYKNKVIPQSQTTGPRSTDIGQTVDYREQFMNGWGHGSNIGLTFITGQHIASAVLNKAWLNDETWHYSVGQNYQYYATQNTSGGHQAVRAVRYNDYYKVPFYIETHERKIQLYPTYGNELYLTSNLDNSNTRFYAYNERGNLKSISHIASFNQQETIVQEAEYDAICTNPKTCNKAKWISDGLGNKTHYTYHSDSGQVTSITLPENEQGIKAQTRYSYEKKFAIFKADSDIATPATDGIWLLTTESYCQNSNFNDGVCENNDQVITNYQYTPSNLQLKSISVTDNNKTLRTCYSYNDLGQRISETTPNAKLTSCP